MPTVRLGHDDGRVTTVVIPESQPALVTVTGGDGVWVNHASGTGPAWVESDDPGLAQSISDHYGCPVGCPSQED